MSWAANIGTRNCEINLRWTSFFSLPSGKYLAQTSVFLEIVHIAGLFLVQNTYLCAMNLVLNIRFCLIFAVSLLLANMVFAQQQGSDLSFLSTTLQFGHISEEGGAVSKTICAVNRGSNTLYIKEVAVTCGCTTANYAQRELRPNDTLHLEVRFDPMNRPGRIDKSLYVTVSDCDVPLRLRMVGYVEPRERGVDELFPFDIGEGLRLESNFHAFGYLEHGKEVEHRIGFVNTSKNWISVELRPQRLSGYIQVVMPERVAPDYKGDILLRYTLEEQNDVYGLLEDQFIFVVNGKDSYYPFSCQAIAVDNFDMVDDISAPRVDISKKNIKFGDVKRRYATVEQSIELMNAGSSPLVLRAVASTSEALSADNVGVEVAPGQSATIVVRLDVGKIEDWDNPFVARLMLITNDPMRPMLSLRVNALPE
jgi:hypothetical protein